MEKFHYQMNLYKRFLNTVALVSSLLFCQLAYADSRILATGGATTFEGQAGGGIVPWSVLAGYGSENEWGASAFKTQLRMRDYSLDSKGFAFSYHNRLEASYARQKFDLGTLADTLAIPGAAFRQDIFGLKYRIAGDLIYNTLPQVTLGLVYKKHLDFDIPESVGAYKKEDYEVYVSVSKLWLAGFLDRNIFANVNGRLTRANQTGLLGFGGDKGNKRELSWEGSIGIFLNHNLALGMEIKNNPENLSFSKQDTWTDIFAAWFINKHFSVVAAYADLGTIATLPDQKAWYLSTEIAY